MVYNQCYLYGKMEMSSNDSLRLFLRDDSLLPSLEDTLNQMRNLINFRYNVNVVVKERNTPKNHILIHFFGGVSEDKDVILTGYSEDNIYEMIELLKEAIKKSEEASYLTLQFEISHEIASITCS